MLIRNLADTESSDREVCGATWVSRRLLLRDDDMGFSLHDTIIHAGTTTAMWYKHHLEAVYCIEGRGSIEDLENEVTHRIEPGVVYALDRNDRHVLRAEERLRLICVFNPPLRGDETHDEDGAYPPPEAAEPTPPAPAAERASP